MNKWISLFAKPLNGIGMEMKWDDYINNGLDL